METAFNSAKSQFQSNYIQYELTRDEKYKTAYETAQRTIESILAKAPQAQEPVRLKTTREKSYIAAHQAPPEAIPSPLWRYLALGTLLLLTTVLATF
jgi:hypothetical protein